jgi:hypothetical protein
MKRERLTMAYHWFGRAAVSLKLERKHFSDCKQTHTFA